MKIVVAHAAWLPDRQRTLARLDDSLGVDAVLASKGREHAAIWARRVWEWAAEQREHVCILNDDVLVHPDFRRIVEAMIEAFPDEPLSLHTNVLGAVAEGMAGHHWCRCYWYTGPAVVLSPEHARELLAWVYRVPWSFASRTNEDNLAIHWAWEQQRPFYCAIPAPVLHDASTPSTLGYDNHPFRVPTVPWNDPRWASARLTDPAWWRVEAPPPLVDNPWMPVAKLEYVRRVLSVDGAQFCATCGVREGIVSPTRDPQNPRVCHPCLMTMHTAACAAGLETKR